MAKLPDKIMRRGQGLPWPVWALFCAGAAAVVFSLMIPPERGIPGWQPANEALNITLDAESKGQRLPASAATPLPPAATPANPRETASSPAPSRLPAVSGLLDLNAAAEADLDALPGIGASKAKAVIAYRNANKGFRSVDELRKVKGIGAKLFERIRPLVTVNAGTPAS